MRLRLLAADSLRNLSPMRLQTDAPFVVALGDNAQGKTNLLEAIWILGALKPLRGARLGDCVAWGAERAAVGAVVGGAQGERTLQVALGRSERLLTLDGAPVSDVAEWTALRVVAFAPDDVAIGAAEPARRRAWLDRAAFTATPAHLGAVRRYRRVLEQKGAALRQAAAPLVLDALDDALVEAGADLVARRARLLADLGPHLTDAHARLAGGSRLELRYRSSPDLRAAVAAARPEEQRRATVLVGPQTDDVDFLVDGRLVRTWGSRGQLRSVVLALKLAEVWAAAARGEPPVFLFDDVGSELDADRTSRLLDLLTQSGAQVFASTTRADPLVGRVPGALWLRVEGGRVTVDPTPSPR